MREVPSLFSLCVDKITIALTHGYENQQKLFELPSDILDRLALNLPPLALQNFHELSLSCGTSTFECINGRRKRERYEDYDSAWKAFFKKRWPEHVKRVELVNCMKSEDVVGLLNLEDHNGLWQQLYWEAHLQDCLDEAAERALLPTFNGHIGELRVSESILTSIAHGWESCDKYCLTLSYHCKRFGFYARSLRLQNVFCRPETCELLRISKLKDLVFRRITSETHVNGVCMLLNQHRETLLSLEFIHCKLPPITFNQIYHSVSYPEKIQHGIVSLCFKSSHIFESKSLIPAGLQHLILSGSSLRSLHFCDTHMEPKHARMIFDNLLECSYDLAALEISDNNLAGWLCNTRFTDFSSLLGSAKSLKSLSVLNLRGNNLCKEDVEDLTNALFHLPILRSLDISDNPIQDEGIGSLIPYFIEAVEKACPLSDIKVENCCLTDRGVSRLLSSLPTLIKPLNTLSIADNDLGSSIAEPLASFLGTSRLRVLNIEDVGLGQSGFEELEKGMAEQTELTSINISKNRGGIGTAYFIAKVILQSPNLESLDARYNIMPSESVQVIYDALKQAQGNLKELNLMGNVHLSQSISTLRLLDFSFRGKPIVIISTSPEACMPYDDDP